MLTTVLAFLTSLAAALFVMPRLAHIASRIGLMDYPDERKVHKNPKPLVGGIGIVMALSVSSILFIPIANLRGFYAGLIMLIIFGFLDDYKEITHRWKFVAQALSAIFIIYLSETVIMSFGDIFSFGPVNSGVLAVPATIFCVVGVINSLNMIDGLDGLAGGIALIAFASFAALSHINGQQELFLLSVAFAGAVAGFLRYNFPVSHIFMGDAGSLSLGFTLAFLSVAVTQEQGGIVAPVAALMVLAVPVIDTVTVMARRMIKGKNPFHADKTHIHHILMRKGFSKNQSVMIILAISACFSVAAVGGTALRIPDYYLFLLFAVYFVFNLLWFNFYPIRLSERADDGKDGLS